MSSGPTSDGQPLLEFRDVDTYYGELHALKRVNYEIRAGEIVCLLGGNASGKSTTMKTVLGIVRPAKGTVVYRGEPINSLPTSERVRRGIAPVPEARRLFPKMTVYESLEMGAYTREDLAGIEQDLERVYRLFPRVKERRNQLAGTLSGGEQQMVAIGRGLMARPTLLMIDEPSLGLAPNIVDRVMEIVKAINKDGTAVLLVEQDVVLALDIADRAYVLENGRVVMSGPAGDLRRDPAVRKAYLGV